jgi:DNA-binding Lrp family transcriptional regulator
MAKSSKKQIESDEKKVLQELQINSRESADDIAKKCGFSRQKAWRIIKKLEENKTIWGYGTVVENKNLNLKEYLVLIKKTTWPIEQLADKIISREIEKKAKNLGVSIISSHYLHGQYDWTFSFHTEDIRKAKKFCEAFNQFYQKYIKELILIEKIFSVKKCGIQNPNIDKLKEFI